MSDGLAQVLEGLEKLRGLKEVSEDYLRFRTELARAHGRVSEKLSNSSPLPPPGGNGSGPALTFESLPLEADVLKDYFSFLLDCFAGNGPAEADLTALREESEEGHEFLQDFCLKAGFRPKENYLASLSRRMEIPVAILGFFGHTLVSPFAALATRRITTEGVDSSEYIGVCPLCESAPAFAALEREEGAKSAYCSLCGHAWTVPRIQCIWCGCEEQEQLRVLLVGDKAPHWIETCSKCKRYAKVFDERRYPEEVSLIPFVEETASLFLDMIAEQEGFLRKYPFTPAI